MITGKLLLAKGGVWVGEVERTTSTLERMKGLLGRPGLGGGHAMVIDPCGAVHSVGMRFALDLVFLDREWRVTRVVKHVAPGRLMAWGGWRAARVVEAEAGCLDIDRLRVGDALVWDVFPQKSSTTVPGRM